MDRVARAAEGAGVSPDRIYTEHFIARSPAGTGHAVTRPCAIADTAGQLDLRVRVSQPNGGYDEVRMKSGATLLDALQKSSGLRVGICGGQAACGTCRIAIGAPWSALIPDLRRHESRLLNALAGHRPDHRLACQIRLNAALADVEFTPAPVA